MPPAHDVTVYLTPELDPACAGDPGSTGNYIPQDVGTITGELVWSGGIEFQRAPWNNIPLPAANERQVAYVFTAAGSPLANFSLPSPSSGTTPMSSGQLGYGYTLVGLPGNTILYALAGLEEDTAAGQVVRFEPFAMGIVRGVPVQPNVTTAGVDIPMTTLLDRALTTTPQPPPSTPRGPTLLSTTVAIDLGSGSYAALPQGTSTTFLPVSGDVSFGGVPALDGTLQGASYDVSATAGNSGSGAPVSAVTGVETTDANDPLVLGGFFDIPVLLQLSGATWSGTHVQIQASGPIDLAVVTISSGNGLVEWQIVAPGSDLSFDLPDLSQVPGVGHLLHGALVTNFAIARISGFQYGLVRSGQLGSSAWSAYAADVAPGSY